MRRKRRVVPRTLISLVAFVVCVAVLAVVVFVTAGGANDVKAYDVDNTYTTTTAAQPQQIKEVIVEKPVIEYVMTPYERTWSDEELFYMAVVIYQEAGGDSCSDSTRIAIGNVVLNRKNSPDFPNTILDVCTDEAQWGRLHWTGMVFPSRAFTEEEAHAVSRAYDCARRVLDGEKVLEDDVIWAAEFEQGETVLHQDGFYFGR